MWLKSGNLHDKTVLSEHLNGYLITTANRSMKLIIDWEMRRWLDQIRIAPIRNQIKLDQIRANQNKLITYQIIY